jgi:hypothetical protein
MQSPPFTRTQLLLLADDDSFAVLPAVVPFWDCCAQAAPENAKVTAAAAAMPTVHRPV